MANQAADELRALTDAELVHKLAEAREELFNLRFQLATGQLDNFSRISHLRREIARINTLLRAREIEAADALVNANVRANDFEETV
jgi:large subunit ribosomal protein L29